MDNNLLYRSVPGNLKSNKRPAGIGPSAFRPRETDRGELSCDDGALCTPQDALSRSAGSPHPSLGIWSLAKNDLGTLKWRPDPIDLLTAKNEAHAVIFNFTQDNANEFKGKQFEKEVSFLFSKAIKVL